MDGDTDEEATMSLQPHESYLIPAEKARVARAIFPKGNLVMRLYDELGMTFHDQDFADLFPFRYCWRILWHAVCQKQCPISS
jgi:hypothetical protein